MSQHFRSGLRMCLLAAAIGQALVALPAVAVDAAGDAPVPSAATQQADAEPPAKKTVALKEVVVTAQRRTQKLEDVPVSVTAIDQSELEARGINNLSDLSAAAPNLTIVSEPGSATSSMVSIRGSVQVNPALYWDTPVGMYVDGVYMGKAAGNVFDLLNLERVEVLRGPQGTLFGRNTMAGAVNLITARPSGVFTGDASVSIGNYGAKVAKAVLDLPAFGKLKATVGARVERRDGWIRTTPGSSESRLNNRHNSETYLGLEYDATDDLTLNYRFDHTSVKQTSLFFQPVHSEVGQIFGIPGIQVYGNGRQTSGVSVDSPMHEQMNVNGHSLTVSWKLGDVGTLKYIGAYRQMHWHDALDLDGSPILFAQTENNSHYHQVSHELQYLGSVGRWGWVAGLYYFKDSGFSNNPQTYFFGQANYDENYGYGTRSRAAYGQVDYKLTDRLTLTAGIRRTEEQKRTSRFEELANYGLVLVPAGTAARASFGATTPALSLSYKLAADSMVYARYAKGFMSGGFNGEAQNVQDAITPYKPQTQNSFELGTKNTLWGGRATLNADVFYNRVNNLQQVVFTAQGSSGSTVLNVGRSHSEGFELEARVRATDDLTLGLNYGYIHSKFDKFMQLGVNVANNRSVQFVPRNTVAFTLDDTLLHTSYGTWRASLDYRFTSPFYMYVYPLTPVNPPTQLAANTRIKSYGVLNARLALGDINLGAATGEVALWAKNVTDKAHIDNLIDFGPGFGNLRLANYNDPRTFGISFDVKW